MRTAGIIVLVIVILLLAGVVGWIIYTRNRAQRLGVCFPSISESPYLVHCPSLVAQLRAGISVPPHPPSSQHLSKRTTLFMTDNHPHLV